MDILRFILVAVIGYLVGSIPMGLITVRIFTGNDVRTVGSGRTGGTNAIRAAGVPVGVLTSFADMGKGIIAVTVARWLLPEIPLAEALAGVMAVAGHNWSIYIGFKGGAGTGPNAGVATALWAPAGLILVPAVPLIIYLSGYASLASTSASLIILAIFVIRAATLGTPTIYIAYAVVTTILVSISLIPNYKRLLDGTERLVGPRAKKAAAHE